MVKHFKKFAFQSINMLIIKVAHLLIVTVTIKNSHNKTGRSEIMYEYLQNNYILLQTFFYITPE